MGHALDDLVKHNIWATEQVLWCCQGLAAGALQATAPGTYGSIIDTLRHLIDAEASYLFRLTGAGAAPPWPEGEAVGVDVLAVRVSVLAEAWSRFLTGDVDTERLGEARGDDTDFTVRAGIFVAQALHHANEHRAHICTILGAQGLPLPQVSAWDYALATGRMWPTALPPAP